MKETEFINNNEPDDIKDFFGDDIEAIAPDNDAADDIDEELTALNDDIKIKAAPEVSFKTNGGNITVNIKGDDEKLPKNLDEVREAIDNNILNETMSIDMDMNKADDPAEVDFFDTEKINTVDMEEMNKLQKNLESFFKKKRKNNEAITYDAALLDKMAELFATYDKINEEIADPSRILYTPEEYKANIDARKKDLLGDPFFTNFLNIEADSQYIKNQGLMNTWKNYHALHRAAEDDLSGNFFPLLGKGFARGVIDYETLMDRCQRKANALTASNADHTRFVASQFMDAADLIIAKTLSTKAAKNSVLEKCKIKGTENYDLEKVNAHVNEMRQEITRDPIFLKLMKDRTPKSDFYKAYREAVNAEMNKNIKASNTKNTQLKKDKKLKDFASKFLDNNTYNIAPDRIETIQTTYADLVELNKSKNPSEYMEKLMTAYENVIKEIAQNNGFVKGSTINTLHKAALKYYDKRQGIISGPSTGKGQARLNTVEKLIKTTEPLMKKVNSDFNKSYKKFLADEKKAAQKNPENTQKKQVKTKSK